MKDELHFLNYNGKNSDIARDALKQMITEAEK